MELFDLQRYAKKLTLKKQLGGAPLNYFFFQKQLKGKISYLEMNYRVKNSSVKNTSNNTLFCEIS